MSKSEFQEVLSDILIGMAAGLKRDPIVILRIDGEELNEYINSPGFESDMILVYSETASPDGTICDHIVKALQKLGVDQGLPPISDSWVMALRPLPIIFFKCTIVSLILIILEYT